MCLLGNEGSGTETKSGVMAVDFQTATRAAGMTQVVWEGLTRCEVVGEWCERASFLAVPCSACMCGDGKSGWRWLWARGMWYLVLFSVI